ncbi:MAG: MFS transporter [Rhodospirillaceae bacterium]|jgi:predicted MFS family arabinose efflux permease|nr:MFS transporter [Rhodospirillaceae bacterium]MBT3931771.1 MFS transporter [Rhodospirillaceae bacterium]
MMTNRWLVLGALFVARSALGFHFQSVASVAPLLVEDLGIDFTAIGTLIGLFSLLGVVTALPAGFLGQRFGERRVCIFGLALMTLGGFVMWLGDGFAMIAVGRMIAGTGGVVITVIMVKIVGDLFEGKEVVTAMAILMNSWPVGIAIGLWSQGALAETWGWQAVFLVAGIGSFVGMLLVAAVYRPGVPAVVRPLQRLAITRMEAAKVSLAGIVWVLYNAGYLMVLSFGPAMLVMRGLDVAAAGLLIANATFVYMFAIPLGGWLSEKLARPNLVMVSCFALGAITVALVPLVDSPLMLFILAAIFIGIPTGNVMALTVETVPAEHRNTGTGLYHTWNHAGLFVGPALAGWIVTQTGDPATAMFVGGTTMALAIVALGALRALQWREARAY